LLIAGPCFTRNGIFNTCNQNIRADENPHSFQETRIQQQIAISVRAEIFDSLLPGPYEPRLRLSGASCLQFLSEQAIASPEGLTIGNMADCGYCPSSGDVTWYWDGLSGQWIGWNGPVVCSRRLFHLLVLLVGQLKEYRLRPTTKHAGPAAELHWKDKNKQHSCRLSADQWFLAQTGLFCKPLVTEQRPFCSHIIKPLSTTALFVYFPFSCFLFPYLANEVVSAIYLCDHFRLPLNIDHDAYI
jgi:hypothetical protein